MILLGSLWSKFSRSCKPEMQMKKDGVTQLSRTFEAFPPFVAKEILFVTRTTLLESNSVGPLNPFRGFVYIKSKTPSDADGKWSRSVL